MLSKEYIPIDCDFHDILLDRITRKKQVFIKYSTNGVTPIRSKHLLLKDVFTKQKQEFLVMENDETIRLDQIVSIDGIIVPNGYSCKM